MSDLTSFPCKEPSAETLPCALASLELALELLWFDFSRPLHRQLLSTVKRLHPSCQALAGQVVTARIQREIASFRALGGWEGAAREKVRALGDPGW